MLQRMNYNETASAGMKALGAVYGYVRKSGLPSRLLDLVFLRVSQINGCAYRIDMHSRDLLKHQLPVEHLALVAVWREAGSIFDDQERAALAWAEIVTRLGEQGVPDSAFEEAAAVFGEKQLADLTIAIGVMSAYNRMAIAALKRGRHESGPQDNRRGGIFRSWSGGEPGQFAAAGGHAHRSAAA